MHVAAQVAFGAETPRAVAHGNVAAPAGPRVAGDTVVLHGERLEQVERDGLRKVELIVNGRAVASQEVPADGAIHSLEFDVHIPGEQLGCFCGTFRSCIPIRST